MLLPLPGESFQRVNGTHAAVPTHFAQTLIALADLPLGCRAWAALPDCNSRDRSGILGADEHLLRGKSYGHEDRPDPACGHERPHTAGEARLFARRHGHRPG